MNTVQEKAAKVIDAAAFLISKGWTRHANARSKRGDEVQIDAPNACRFCMIGAIARAYQDLKIFDHDVDTEIRNRVHLVLPHNFASMIDFNDYKAKSKKDVIDLFQRTIDRLKALTPA